MPACEKSTFGDYIWLSYSAFFFIEPILRNQSRYWFKNAILYLVFLAVYVAYTRARRRPSQLALLASMASLGLLGFRFNAGASCFLTFAAAFLPFVLEDIATIIVCLITGAVLVTAEGLLLHVDWISLAIAPAMIAIVGSSNIFIGQKKRANARLSMAHEEIERLAALAERERIARDMHDVLGHTLSVIVLKSELARRLLEQQVQISATVDYQTAIAEIADIENTARTALAEVRNAIGGYRSPGLGAELDLARRTLRSAGVTLDLDTSIIPSSLILSATEETVLSLAVREAVTNIVRHARATTCLMRLSLTPDGFHALLVEDDGHSEISREGNGLRGMRERVQGLGGRFHVSTGGASLPGTALLVELPATAGLQRSRP